MIAHAVERGTKDHFSALNLAEITRQQQLQMLWGLWQQIDRNPELEELANALSWRAYLEIWLMSTVCHPGKLLGFFVWCF